MLSKSGGLTRDELIEAICRVIEVGLFRMDSRYTKNQERIRWARAVTQAVGVANEVLKDKEIEELGERIGILERIRL